MAEDIVDSTANWTSIAALAAASQANSSEQPCVSDGRPVTTTGAAASTSCLDNHATSADGSHDMDKDHVSSNADSNKNSSDAIDIDDDNASNTMEVDVDNKASDKDGDSDGDEDYDPANHSDSVPDVDINNMCDEDEEDGAEEEEGELSSGDDVEGPPDGAELKQIKAKCQNESLKISNVCAVGL